VLADRTARSERQEGEGPPADQGERLRQQEQEVGRGHRGGRVAFSRMSAPDHFDFYTFVLFVHIAAAVIAFGATFAFPIIDLTIRRVDLRALPVWNDAQNQIGMKLITPGAILVLLSGIYMASDRWDKFGGLWFSLAGAIVIVLLGLGHGFFAPTARKMRDQARADLAGGAAERGAMS